MTFLDLQNDAIAYLGRPASEVRDLVKRELNASVKYCLMQHAFKYAESLAQITYPANTLYVELASACDSEICALISLQLLPNSSATDGYLLDLVDFASLQARKSRWQETSTVTPDYPTSEQVETFRTYLTAYSGPSVAFLADVGFGLYPTPTVPVYLQAHFSRWLPDLVNDTDTNFLVKFGRDFLIDRTVRRCLFYVKADNRLEAAVMQERQSWDALLAWDKQVRSGSILG